MGYGGGRGGGLVDVLSVLSMFSQAQGQGKGSWGKGKGKGKGKDPKFRTKNQLLAIAADRKVWVGGLPDDVTWKDLETHFELNATKPGLTEILSKGTGVCAFKSAEEATAAIAALNGSTLKDNTIQVDVWTAKESNRQGVDPSKQKIVSVALEHLSQYKRPVASDKRALEQRVKDLQRSDPEAKATWWAFTDAHHGGIHDPTKHTKEVLEEFLSAFT